MTERLLKVDGNDVYYMDYSEVGHSLTGTIVGGSMTPRYKVKGNYLYYRDMSDVVRSLLGSVTEYSWPDRLKIKGDLLCYKDFSDVWRCITLGPTTIYAAKVPSDIRAMIEGIEHTYDDVHEMTTGDLDENHLMYVQSAGLGYQYCGITKQCSAYSPYYSFWIWRGGLVGFDVSGLSGKTVLTAIIKLRGRTFSELTSLDPSNYLTLVPGGDIGSYIVQLDYEELVDDTTNYGQIRDTDWNESGDNEINLTAVGVQALQAAIDGSGTFTLGTRCTYDINKVGIDNGCPLNSYFSWTGGVKADDERPRLLVTC